MSHRMKQKDCKLKKKASLDFKPEGPRANSLKARVFSAGVQRRVVLFSQG